MKKLKGLQELCLLNKSVISGLLQNKGIFVPGEVSTFIKYTNIKVKSIAGKPKSSRKGTGETQIKKCRIFSDTLIR